MQWTKKRIFILPAINSVECCNSFANYLFTYNLVLELLTADGTNDDSGVGLSTIYPNSTKIHFDITMMVI